MKRSAKAMFEIFRFEDGLAAEHWSSMMDHPENTASGNSMFDGATEIKDLDKTDTNKEIIKTLMDAAPSKDIDVDLYRSKLALPNF